LKRSREETSGQVCGIERQLALRWSIQSRDRSQVRGLRRRKRRRKTVVRSGVPAIQRTICRLLGCAMLAGFALQRVILWHGSMICRVVRCAMRQTAHSVAARHFRAHRPGQQRKRGAQQCQDHEKGLDSSHRAKTNTPSRNFVWQVEKISRPRHYGLAGARAV